MGFFCGLTLLEMQTQVQSEWQGWEDAGLFQTYGTSLLTQIIHLHSGSEDSPGQGSLVTVYWWHCMKTAEGELKARPCEGLRPTQPSNT